MGCNSSKVAPPADGRQSPKPGDKAVDPSAAQSESGHADPTGVTAGKPTPPTTANTAVLMGGPPVSSENDCASTSKSSTDAKPAAEVAARQLTLNDPAPAKDLLDLVPTDTIAAVCKIVEAWNNQSDSKSSGSSAAESLLKAVKDLPGIAQTLGALGEHAPIVGVVFAVLKVAGDRVSAVNATRAKYEALARAVGTTTKLVVQAVNWQASTSTPFPKLVQDALDLYWAQLGAFATMLVEFRGKNYAQRLWSQGQHLERLEAIQRGIDEARANLRDSKEWATVIAVAEIRDVIMELKSARPKSSTWDIACAVNAVVGRSAELERLAALLQPAPARTTATHIVVTGMGGTGKSTLARFAAQQHHARFTQGWVLDGSTEATAMFDFAKIALALNLSEVKPNELSTAVGLKLSEPAQEGWLLVVDNVDDSVFRSRLLAMLPKVNGCVVLTSRLSGWSDWTVVALSALPDSEAVRLLSDTTTEEAAALTEVAKLLGGLPLALANARAYVQRTGITWQEYVFKIKNQANHIFNKPTADNKGTLPSLQLSIQAAMEKDAAVATLLHLIQMLHPDNQPRRIVLDTFTELHPTEDADDVLAILVDYSIVSRTPTSIAVHRLMQAAMRAVAPCPLTVLDTLVSFISAAVEKHRRDDASLMRQLLLHLEELLPQLAQLAPDSLTLASTLHTVGAIQCYTLANKPPAYVAFQKALALQQAKLGENHLDVAKTLRRLGISSSDYHEMKGLCEQALAINVNLFGHNHVEVASTLVNLSGAYRGLGNYVKQKELLEEALAIQTRPSNSNHVAIAITLHNLGDAHGSLGDYKGQKALMERALAIKEKHYGPDHAQVAITLHGLGNAHGNLGDYKEQKTLLERALAIKEKHYGPDHVHVAYTLHSLGSAYGSLGDHATEKALFERVLPIYERHFGADRVEVARALHGLGNAHGSLGDHGTQKALFERVLPIYERQLGAEHVEVATALYCLGDAHGSLGDHAMKKALLERALAIEEKHYGPNDVKLTSTLTAIGKACGALNDHGAQIKLLKRVLEIEERHYGPEHVEVAYTLNNLAAAFGETADLRSMMAMTERSLSIFVATFGESHAKTCAIAEALDGTKKLLERSEQ